MENKNNIESKEENNNTDNSTDKIVNKNVVEDYAPNIVTGETCPICGQKTLTLSEAERDIPFFGKVYLFSMNCSNPECKYSVSDVETEEQHEPSEYSLEVSKEEHLNARVIKSSNATVRVGRIMTITPGTASQGYISNIEGVLKRTQHALEMAYDMEDDNSNKKKLKNKLKKLRKVLYGSENITITISDPSGNSAIIHEDAVKKVLKSKKK